MLDPSPQRLNILLLQYVPSYKVNLLSVDTAVSFGHRIIFHDSQARMVLNDDREIKLKKDTGLFFLKVNYQNQVNPSTCNETKQGVKGDINLWHKRLGHLNKIDVKRTIGCEGDAKDVCETCAMGKQARISPIPKVDDPRGNDDYLANFNLVCTFKGLREISVTPNG